MTSNKDILLKRDLIFDLFSDLEQDGFSKNPFFHAIVAEVPEQHKTKDGERMK